MIPVGQPDQQMYLFRDPEGVGRWVTLPDGAALLALLMDGQRTLPELQLAFRAESGIRVELRELSALIDRLEKAFLLEGPRFQAEHERVVEEYLGSPVRPALFAGGAYAAKPSELALQLAELFDEVDLVESGSEPPQTGRLCGAITPHIDLCRGGNSYAEIYGRIAAQSDADLFVIFGTAHRAMNQWFSVSRKHFATPLGLVETDLQFVASLARHLDTSLAGQMVDLFDDELVQRVEHCIEFQAVLLRYALSPRRSFRIVPILVNGFQPLIDEQTGPDGSPEIQAFLAALRDAAAEYPGRICYLGAADLAHVGQQFGDSDLLADEFLSELGHDDRRLLQHAACCDANAFYHHVSRHRDRHRICGLAPAYVLLEAIAPAHGMLIRYDQALEPDRTSCVSFASMAFYEE